jgi:patatin-like phospholipase/acyl hydrolase
MGHQGFDVSRGRSTGSVRVLLILAGDPNDEVIPLSRAESANYGS